MSHVADDEREQPANRNHVVGRRRDETYYFDDGSCVLLVKDRLFNVHRSILSKDGSTFRTLFAPFRESQLGLPSEGRSEDNPIELTGDTPQEFKDFLWALYALPHELQAVTSPTVNLGQLINIARISNKYSFKSVETWALDAIQDSVNRQPSSTLCTNPSAAIYTHRGNGASSSEYSQPAENTVYLTQLISLAQLCGHKPLLDTTINFLRELMPTSIHYAYLAMALADEFDLKDLRGAAYLGIMLKSTLVTPLGVDLGLQDPSSSAVPSTSDSLSTMAYQNTLAAANALAPLTASLHGGTAGSQSPSPPPSSTPWSGGSPPLPITPSQRLRLLSGYYRLSQTWEQLRVGVPHFEHVSSCTVTYHQHRCEQWWLAFWKEQMKADAVLGLGCADVLGRMRVVQRVCDRWRDSTDVMHPGCRVAAKKALSEIARKVEEALGDYFGEPGI